MTALWLVRHASTDWTGHRYAGISDPPLDAAGQDAAAALAMMLGPVMPTGVRIIASPSRRARATAEAIAASADVDAVWLDPRWREADMGIAEGRTFDELVVLAPDLARRLAAGESVIDWPDGESAAAFRGRIEAAVADLRADPRPTVVVSHAGPIRLAVALVTGRPSDTVALPEPGTAQRLEL